MAITKERFGRFGYKTANVPLNGIYTIKDGISTFQPQLTELYDRTSDLKQFFTSKFLSAEHKEELQLVDAIEFYSRELEWITKRLYIKGNFNPDSKGENIRESRENSGGKVMGEFLSSGRMGTTAYIVRDFDEVYTTS